MKQKKRQKVNREKDGYSSAEMRALTNQMIDAMVERLRKRLKVEREQQERRGRVRNVRHEVAV